MPDDAAVNTETRKKEDEHQPDTDVGGLRLVEQFLAVLDTQESFCGHDSAVHPALSAHSLTCRVGSVHVVLSATYPSRVRFTMM